MFSLMDSALDAVGASDDKLEEAVLAIREADLHRRTRRGIDLIGLITRAPGLSDNKRKGGVPGTRGAARPRRTGRVIDLIGLIPEATGLEAEVGEVCTIETGRGRASVPAEVVGFRQGRTLLMPLGEPAGI